MPFFGRMGPLEIGLIVLIILIVFGVGKLPQVGSAIGKGMRAFRKGQAGEEEDTVAETKAKSETANNATKDVTA